MHATPSEIHLIDVLADRSSAEVDAILSDDVRFRSPYADYTGRADGDVQGVLVEQDDETGALVDAMLTIRPYAGLRASMQAMQALMEDSPLPSAAT
jgi:hypothetical protein